RDCVAACRRYRLSAYQWLVLLAVRQGSQSKHGRLAAKCTNLGLWIYCGADVLSRRRRSRAFHCTTIENARVNDVVMKKFAVITSTATTFPATTFPATKSCPALLITAPGSGHGKTSITAALARFYSRQDLHVRCFKVGPDFIDPTILMQASAQAVYNLDPWIMGVEHCRQLLFDAAQTADLILIEGMMGLFDGNSSSTNSSSADIAALFDIPIVPVIDSSAMAQTFGAVVHGLATYRDDLRIAGAVANRVASVGHAQMLQASLRDNVSFTAVMRSDEVVLPERHLGLQLANEIGDLDARLDALADLLEGSALATLPASVEFSRSAT